jgi:protein-arginine kinase activator protein McsA
MIELCDHCGTEIAEYACRDCYNDSIPEFKMCDQCTKYHIEESNSGNKVKIEKLEGFVY